MKGTIPLAASVLLSATDATRLEGQDASTLPAVFLTATPTSLDFGGTAAGTTTARQSATVSNPTDHIFPVLIPISGPFLITGNTCGKFLVAGSSCEVAVAFSPVMPGNFTGTLTFFPSKPSPVVSLRGSAPQLGTSSVSRVVNIADLPDVQPLPPGTPAAPTGDEEGSSGTTGPVGTLSPGVTQAPATLSVGAPANNDIINSVLSVGPSLLV